MMAKSFLKFGLGLSHVSMALASSSAQYLTTGSPSNPPFGLPPSDFALAITNPVSNASFPTTGYNTSIPAGPADATGNEVPGWYLSISVAANVPLTNASVSSISTKDKKSKFIEAAVLSLVPPSTNQEGLDAESWRVCAIVFPGGLSGGKTETAQTARLDGTCAALLPSECIQGLQINSVANNTGKGKEEGACGSLAVPDACLEYFGGTVGVGYVIDSSNFDQMHRRYSFFAGASAPASKDNATALVAMERVVWPVVITWTHFSSSGEVHDSAGWLSCVKAPNTTNWMPATNAGMGKGKSMWALIVALVLTGVVTTI